MGELMVPAFVPLVAVVIVLVCLIYFFMTSIVFLFVRLDIRDVSILFRGLLNNYLRLVGITGLAASGAFAASAHMVFAAAMLVIAATAITMRRRVIQQVDAEQSAFALGDAGAMRRLRSIHWSVMLANVVALAGVMSGLPFIL